jgi:hypothetical protein
MTLLGRPAAVSAGRYWPPAPHRRGLPLKLLLLLLLLAAAAQTALSWESLCSGGNLYWYHQDANAAHSPADTACMLRHVGARLAMIKSAADTDAVRALIAQAPGVARAWVGVNRTSGTLKNIDNTAYDSTLNWCTNYPANANSDCVKVDEDCSPSSSGFKDASCLSAQPFICKQPNACSGTTTTFSACSSTTRLWLHVDQYITSAEAQAFCKAQHGSKAVLAAPATAANWDAARSLVGMVTGAQARVDLRRSTPLDFVLPSGAVTGAEVPWCPNEPNNAGGAEACVVLSSNCGNGASGTNDVQCASPYGVLCSVEDACKSSGYCLSDSASRVRFVLYHNQYANRNEALAKCQEEHGAWATLAATNTSLQMGGDASGGVYGWLKTQAASDAWVGLARSGTSSTFLLPGGSPPTGSIGWCTGSAPSYEVVSPKDCTFANTSCPGSTTSKAAVAAVECSDRLDGGVLCSIPAGCPNGLSRCVGNYSIMLHPDIYRSRADAQAYCVSRYGSYASLAVLDTSAQWAAALEMLLQVSSAAVAWVAATRQPSGGAAWVLPSGQAPANLTWCPGEPNNMVYPEDCLALMASCGTDASRSGGNDAPCSVKAAVMCSAPNGCRVDKSCASSSGTQLSLYREVQANSAQAAALCAAKHGNWAQLAALSTAGDWAAAASLVKMPTTTTEAWVGLVRSASNGSAWVLPSAAAPAVSPVWCSGEPGTAASGKNCTVLDASCPANPSASGAQAVLCGGTLAACSVMCSVAAGCTPSTACIDGRGFAVYRGELQTYGGALAFCQAQHGVSATVAAPVNAAEWSAATALVLGVSAVAGAAGHGTRTSPARPG